MAKIRMVEGGDNSPDSITETKPKLLFVEKKDDVKVKFLNPKNKDEYIDFSSAVLSVFNPLYMNHFVDSYYVALAEYLLQRIQVLKEMVWLTPLDIQHFDHRKPVYLSKYGCCFYVNKINNYQPNKLTEVELVTILSQN